MTDYTVQLSSWMNDLPVSVKQRPLNKITIPGSHDSLTYAIAHTAPAAPDLKRLFSGPYQMVPGSRFLLSPYFRLWSRTQNYNCLEQLNAGIRYFDLRVAPRYHHRSGKMVISVVHGLYSCELLPHLGKINWFLDSHVSEFIILDFQHFYGFTPALHETFVETLKSMFSPKICPKMESATVSLKDLIARNQRVLIVYRENDYAIRDSMLWTSDTWLTAWPNTMQVEYMLEFAESHLATRSKKWGFITQMILTTDADTVKRQPLSGVKQACAKKAFPAIMKWLAENAPSFTPCVIISDFIDMENCAFCKNVIAVNFAKRDSVNFVHSKLRKFLRHFRFRFKNKSK